jgi:hypothetical protein
MMHAALDYVDELHTNKWRKRNTKWIGKLCPMEETVIYGEYVGTYSYSVQLSRFPLSLSHTHVHLLAFVTPTSVKMLAMVQDPVRELDLKLFFVCQHCDCGFVQR